MRLRAFSFYPFVYLKGFIWFADNGDGFSGEIFSDDYEKISQYLKAFSDKRFAMLMFSLDSSEKISSELSRCGVNIKVKKRFPESVYRDEPFKITPPADITMREIYYENAFDVEKYYKEKGYPDVRAKHIIDELKARDVFGNTEQSVFVFGIYRSNSLIGMSLGGLQRVHGFAVNNCIETGFIGEIGSEEISQYAYKFVTNAALEKGALPFDDIQYEGAPYKSGMFNSADLGYENVTDCCVLE